MKNYKGNKCICGKYISTGSKSGFCNKCFWIDRPTKQISLVCRICSISFLTYPCRKGIKLYCSRKCFNLRLKLYPSRYWLGKKSPYTKENHWNWKGGISVNRHSPNEPKYKKWRLSVFSRDKFRCRTCDSKSGLQAHHILRWADYPELRYCTSNGITLCHAHHPRKRAEEKRLSPYFQELVSVSND